MVKSYGVVVVVGGGPGHFTVSTGTGRSFDSRFLILYSIPRSQVPGPKSQVPSPKSQSQSLDNICIKFLLIDQAVVNKSIVLVLQGQELPASNRIKYKKCGEDTFRRQTTFFHRT